MKKFLLLFCSIYLTSNAQNNLRIDALLADNQGVFVRFQGLKSDNLYEIFKNKTQTSDGWSASIMESDGKSSAYISISGKDKSLNDLEKYFFSIGIEKIFYNNKILPVNEISENYTNPLKDEIYTPNRLKNK